MQTLWRKRGNRRDELSALDIQSVPNQSQADRSITRVVEVTIKHETIAEGQYGGKDSSSGYTSRSWDPVAGGKEEEPSPYLYRAVITSGDPGKSFATDIESVTCQKEVSANELSFTSSVQSNKLHRSVGHSGFKTWRPFSRW
jgi:hypothetical protein